MSTERLPFGFNSLIPETYKSKAEAFAKCLQHKLLSLRRLDASSDSFGAENKKRLSDETQEGGPSNSFSEYSRYNQFEETKTVDSDDEFCSHSESENSDLPEQKKQAYLEGTKRLTSMSSEDSTVGSWSSCQDNLADFDKLDSENEEVNNFASQIKGSPKLRNFHLRCKRKEIREKPWKRGSRKNHSSSTESVDSEGKRQTSCQQIENFDSDTNPQYILFDGPEEDDVPHRILRESSSTSNLERHFNSREDSQEFDSIRNSKVDRRVSTPPPSPNLRRINGENIINGEESNEKISRLKFAETKTELDETKFDEVELMQDFTTDDISKCVKKIGGVIVECLSDNLRTEEDVSDGFDDLVVTTVEVFENNPDDDDDPGGGDEPEKEVIIVVADEKTDDEILNSHSKLRRCSSLKTWKTPPGTPGAKKIVRFADALGLDLADVRTYLDEIPKIPRSAYEDLHFELPPTDPLPPPIPSPTLIPLFQQPGTKMDFLEKIQHQKVCLESALVTDACVLAVSGIVRVQNMSFHKSVHVRYSLDNWETFSDLQATYVPNSCDGFSDKFSFILYGHTLKIGQKLEFALRLECSGNQYWDNNGGINYVFNCLPQTSANSFFSSLTATQIDPWFDFY